MQTVIKIGVTFTGSDEKQSNYVKWLKANERVEIFHLSPLNTDLESINKFDGIVLSGGIDMHPKYYQNKEVNYPNAPRHFNEKRDQFEMAVFEKSQQNNIPLLGVCRGMQLVNCIMGGNLIQDIGPVANAIHRSGEHDKAHGINITPGSLLNEIMGVARTVANSAHHQSIDTIGNGLNINCVSDDGIIEGLEWTHTENKPFFLGIQWHPERMYKLHLGESPVAKNIRDRFIKEIKKSNGNLRSG